MISILSELFFAPALIILQSWFNVVREMGWYERGMGNLTSVWTKDKGWIRGIDAMVSAEWDARMKFSGVTQADFTEACEQVDAIRAVAVLQSGVVEPYADLIHRMEHLHYVLQHVSGKTYTELCDEHGLIGRPFDLEACMTAVDIAVRRTLKAVRASRLDLHSPDYC